ncbi:hypothetical protein M104_1451 [Bacteroides fragilis str. 1007-1-F |uniref:Uncharacterized protein n=1 Tax=Bacteroides fragilis str. 1007-1-F \|nr:hypothetical protein M101_1166 [Bacteroides fragilis str. 1007-1-F \
MRFKSNGRSGGAETGRFFLRKQAFDVRKPVFGSGSAGVFRKRSKHLLRKT